MAVKPSQKWREAVAREARELAAGTRDPDDACMARLFPVRLLDDTDAVLGCFEDELCSLTVPSDVDVLRAVEHLVLELNAVNDRFGSAYETCEREALCRYVDEVLGEHRIDVGALTARQGLGRHEITDRWRDW